MSLPYNNYYEDFAMAFLKRKPTRIPGYDYSTQNYYFITICTHEKKCIFGVAEKKNAFGIIAEKYIEKNTTYIFRGEIG